MSAVPLDHSGLETLGAAECRALLAAAPVGRVAFGFDGEIVVLPVNHAVDGDAVVFRTGWGAALAAADSRGPVSFEVDGYDEAERTGWSVLVQGRAERVYDDPTIARLEGLAVRPWADAAERPFWVRVLPLSVTGRRIPPHGAA